ncbi:hypothetical protein [Falsiroseomonas oryzae]|uniref:hypothetical protein n=1 Tax=Falsiroseomonas oryzae TaxID=2766473 RepID=UPI0022EB1C4B|nr:hypothetical protein [Roseomonas sp. MO-31]
MSDDMSPDDRAGCLENYFGSDTHFAERYCAARTLARLPPALADLARRILRTMTTAAPSAAQATPGWKVEKLDPAVTSTWTGSPDPLVVFGKPVAHEKDGCISIHGPRAGICVAGQGETAALHLWADEETLRKAGWPTPSATATPPGDTAGWARWRGGKPTWIRLAALRCPDDLARDFLRAVMDVVEDAALPTRGGDALRELVEAAATDLSAEGRDQCGGLITPAIAEWLRKPGKDAAQRGGGPTRPRAPSQGGAGGAGPAAPQPTGTLGTAVVTSWPAARVLRHRSVPPPDGLGFLNLAFEPKRTDIREDFAGPGIYGLFFRMPGGTSEDFRLIYVGRFYGEEYNMFAGDVRHARWWTHAASFTMRDHRVHVARRTSKACRAGEEARLSPLRILGCRSLEKFVNRRGNCGAGLNRVRFAGTFWDRLHAVSADVLLEQFRFAYIRLVPPGSSAVDLAPAIRRQVSQAEDQLIAALKPCGNWQTRWSPDADAAALLTVDETCFLERAKAALELTSMVSVSRP